MADFNEQVPDIQVPDQRVLPVVDNSTAQAVQGLAGLGSDIGSAALNTINYNQQVKQAKYKAQALGELQQNIERIQDLHEQGIMSQDQALRNIRRVTVSSVANHPLLQDDVNKLVGTLTGSAMQNEIENGTQAEQVQRANEKTLQTGAIQAGFMNPNDPPDVQAKMVKAYQGYQLASAQLKQQTDQVHAAQAQVDLGNARLQTTSIQLGQQSSRLAIQRSNIGLIQDQHQINLQQSALGVAQAQLPALSKQLDDIRNNKALNPEQKVQAYTTAIQAPLAAAGAISVQGNVPAYNDFAAGMYKRLVQPYIDEATGKTTTEVANGQIGALTATAQLSLVKKDPDFLNLSAASKMLPTGMAALQGDISNKAVKVLQSHGNLPGTDGNISNKPESVVTDGTQPSIQGVKQASAILIENLKQANSGAPLDVEHRTEINNNLGNFIKSFAIHGNTANDATDLKAAVETLASPQVGLYMSNPKNTVDKSFNDKAADVMNTAYSAEVIPLVQKQFLNDMVIVGRNPSSDPALAAKGATSPVLRPDASQITLTWNGGRAEFTPNDPSNASVVTKAAILNNNVAPILGTMARANAHLHGSTDYDKYGNSLLNSIQPPPQPDNSSAEKP